MHRHRIARVATAGQHHRRPEGDELVAVVAPLADRILFLDGLPNFQAIGRLKIGETVEEVLCADLALEMEAIPLLKDAIAHAESVRDFVSRDLFAAILDNEEDHVDTLETQFEMIQRIGLENYVALQSEAAEGD